MRSQTIFTTESVNQLAEAIFVTHLSGLDECWEDNWQLLLDDKGNMITDMFQGIKTVRKRRMTGVGLATFNQARLGNAEWDNF